MSSGPHLTGSQVYGHLWTTDEMRDMFCDEGRLARWVEILAVLAEAQADLDLIPHAAARGIRDFADHGQVDVAEVGRLTRECGHSTLGLIRHLRQQLPPPASEYVYLGATVQDLTDTWMSLVLRATTDLVLSTLGSMATHLVELTERHRDTVMAGRTHGQPGLPITFGLKTAGWLDEVRRNESRLRDRRTAWERGQLAGALGTMEYWGDRGPDLLAAFCDHLELAEPTVPWTATRDGLAEFATTTAMSTATCARIANEVYDLQRAEVGELREPLPEGVVGSITMPHKRNPERSEHVVTLARLVRRHADTAIEGMVSQHERDGRAWKAEWAILPELCSYTLVAHRLTRDLLASLEIDVERMRGNIDALDGYMASPQALRLLSSRVGKHSAHEHLYEAARAGARDGLGFVEALEAAEIPHADEVIASGVLAPEAGLGATARLIDRALKAHR